MNPLSRLLHAILKRWAPQRLKQRVWDAEYLAGQWAELAPGTMAARPRDAVYSLLDRYAANADVLDLGCGTGSTAAELEGDFRSYLGVDISPVAVTAARNALDAIETRRERTSFLAADIEQLSIDRHFDLILYRECLYYFPLPRMLAMLAAHRRMLHPHGVMVARFHDRQRYHAQIAAIAENYALLAQVEPEGEATTVLLFCPREAASAVLATRGIEGVRAS